MLYLILPPVIIVVSIFLVIWLFYRRKNETNLDELVDVTGVETEKSVVKGKEKAGIKKFDADKSGDIIGVIVVYIKKIFEKIHDLVARVSLMQRKKDVLDLPEMDENVKDIESKYIKQEEQEMILEPVRPEKDDDVDFVEQLPEKFTNKEKKVKAILVDNQKKIDLYNHPTISEIVIHPEKTSDSRAKLEDILIERIASNPRDLEAYERLGEYYIDQKNYKDARECFSQVLKLSPKHVKAKINLQKIGVLIDEEGKREIVQ